MPPNASRRRVERVLAVGLSAQLLVAGVAAVELQPGPSSKVASRPVAVQVVNGRADVQARTASVRALLHARATAVLRKDRLGFLATVDPLSAAFRGRQAKLVDALHDVPLASWSYELDATHDRAHTAALDAHWGTWWAPDVTLRYALESFDQRPTVQPQALTFVRRGTRWYVGSDDDFATSGHSTTRDLWDGGAVVVVRGVACLVLSHPGHAALARSLVDDCDAAVPRVSAVWGRGWSRRVVLLVPDTTRELARIVPDSGELGQIAAVATAELLAPSTGYHPVGDRIIVNPSNFRELGSVGRRVVLTHEVTHVASRGASGAQVPTWLVEGLADYVGYQGVRVPLSVSAEELRADVRAGRVPRALPVDAAFAGSRKDLAQTYEQSWLAVVLIARTYGQPALLRLYRDTGADTADGSLGRAMVRDLHTSLLAFTMDWRADLRRRLS